MASSTATTLESFGATSGSQVSLTDEITSHHINYLDLIKQSGEEVTPSVVVEFQRKPILYVVESQNLSSDPETKQKEVLKIRRMLACRGDANYMAVLKPGEIEVYSIGFGLKVQLPEPIIRKQQTDGDASSVIPSIALGKLYPERDAEEEKIHDLLFRLMKYATEDLRDKGIDTDDALSLTGRALFLRFLMDRKVVTEDNLNDICPGANNLADCLSDSKKADFSNAWLDITFNGDLLPISQRNISQLLGNVDEEKKKGIFTTLTQILKGSKFLGKGISQEHLNWHDSWQYINFAHVPVGLLSQVYERHCHTYDSTYAEETSVHYTPRNIAEYMVEEVFSDLENDHQVKILDPAAGAGVFLVICFRKLVENWWKETNERPDREIIRRVLYNQIRGFEINTTALNLAAFSLYLTAIELDPKPADLNDIKFEKIIGKVLFDVCSPKEKNKRGPVLGSLNSQNTQGHEGIYDIVIGNPPWKSVSEEYKPVRNRFHSIIKKIAYMRGLTDVAKYYRNPDGVPDLPFVWRATQWCKDGGRVAFALHSRLLFKNSDIGVRARDALFSALKITGILNGSYLRQTEIWPEVDAPFCLLFAKNTIPDPDTIFTYISPELESNVNSSGRFRIDSESAQPIQISCLKDNSNLLKALFRGTALDFQIIDKIKNNNVITIKNYFRDKTLANGQGYQVKGDKNKADFLKGYGNLTKENLEKYRKLTAGGSPIFFICPDKLPRFESEIIDLLLHRPRDHRIYFGPMLLVKQSPSTNRNGGRAMLCLKNMAFNESFYSYSGRGHPNGEELSKYLLILIHSKLFLYYTLMTSGVFGVERDRIYKEDIDNFPMIPIENLGKKDLWAINNLVDKLINEKEKPWSELDQFVYQIYGIDKFDQEVIRDSLDVGLPFAKSKKRAQEPPKPEEIKKFAERLEQALKPFYEILSRQISIAPVILENYPWAFLELSNDLLKKEKNDASKKIDIVNVMEIADKTGASRIIIRLDNEHLLIGILKQYRYWTPTRARLTAIHLLRNKAISHS